MKPNTNTPIHNQYIGEHISFGNIRHHPPPGEKILDILLYLSVRDPIAFDLIHTRYLKTAAHWIAFTEYSKTCPKRDGIGYTSRQAIIRFLSTCHIDNISRGEAIILTRICRPRPDQIPNLRPLFERIRILDD